MDKHSGSLCQAVSDKEEEMYNIGTCWGTFRPRVQSRWPQRKFCFSPKLDWMLEGPEMTESERTFSTTQKTILLT